MMHEQTCILAFAVLHNTRRTSLMLIQSVTLPNLGRIRMTPVQDEMSHVWKSVVSPEEMADGMMFCWRSAPAMVGFTSVCGSSTRCDVKLVGPNYKCILNYAYCG